jgi:lysophospholipase L1-like esterase
VACSGDTVADLESRQLGALNDDVDVITIGIGGNDVGFADVVETCGFDTVTHPVGGSGKGCNDIIADEFKTGLPELRDSLRRLYRNIHLKAPNAKVIVVGYPALFEDSWDSVVCTSSWIRERRSRTTAFAATARTGSMGSP